MENSSLKGVMMTPLQMTVLAGVLMLITAMNLKIAIWYIERKQAKQALESYTNPQSHQEDVPANVPFLLSEVKSVENIEKNIDTYLDALSSKEMEKVGIIKDEKLVAVMVPIERLEQYEKIIASYSKQAGSHV